jgi:hypothetical protein
VSDINDLHYIEELKAENERLRADVGRLNAYGEELGWIHPGEVEHLRAEVKGQKFATLGEWERLRAQVKLGEHIAHDLMLTQQEVERLRNLYDQADLARAQLELRVTRLRKAVNWLRGALHQEAHIRDGVSDNPYICEVWECQRARGVLEEEAEK